MVRMSWLLNTNVLATLKGNLVRIQQGSKYTYHFSYPPKLRSLLIPTFFLIFSSSLDVQMAAAFIIKR